MEEKKSDPEFTCLQPSEKRKLERLSWDEKILEAMTLMGKPFERAKVEPVEVKSSNRLRVSENRRFLVREDGAPFYWFGDTAWEIFHRANREEAEQYLKKRAEQGFTVIQAAVLAEFQGIREPNAYGALPLVDADPTRPDEAYFSHVDWIVLLANQLGLTIGMLPTWGDKVGTTHGDGPPIFDRQNARIYGEYLGKRYRDAAVVWIIGGDRAVDSQEKREIWSSLGEGLRAGDEGQHLVTF